MKYLLNNNTVNEKLTNGSVDLEKAATGLDEVLSALDAIMPCLPGSAPRKVEYGKIKSAASTTTTGLRWRLHPAFAAGGAASLVGTASPFVA